MSTRFIISCLFILGLSACSQYYNQSGQEELGYRIENNQVVFEFDIRDYQLVTMEGRVKPQDFADIDIEEVAIAGDFNNWSKNGWKMRKVGDHIFQLRKKLKDFEGKIEWQYKFIVNERYWIEPPQKAKNKRGASTYFGRSQNLVLNTDVPSPSLQGNTTFTLNAYPKAQKIVLCGDFNQWNEKQYYFGRENGQWVCRIDLEPGQYIYKFIVDGEWIVDPQNPRKAPNQHGTFNSVLFKSEQQSVFRLEGYSQAKQVSLAASFNNWQAEPCQANEEGWVYKIKLPPGKYHYNFVVDGQSLLDPKNPSQEKSSDHTVKSVYYVGNTVNFLLKGYHRAQKIVLAGTFNNWNEQQYVLKREGDYWLYPLNLPPGEYEYKFIVDGKWILDPDNPMYRDDGRGNINSVMQVGK